MAKRPPLPPSPICAFVRGKTYVVTYRIKGVEKIDRKFRALFLSEDEEGELVFSGRPAYGTTEIQRKHIIAAEESTGDPYPPVRA